MSEQNNVSPVYLPCLLYWDKSNKLLGSMTDVDDLNDALSSYNGILDKLLFVFGWKCFT